MTKMPDGFHLTMQLMNDVRETMRARVGGIGEPAVYLPTEELKMFTNADGNVDVILGMDQFVYLVERVLRGALVGGR